MKPKYESIKKRNKEESVQSSMAEMIPKASCKNLQSRYTIVDFVGELARDALFSAIIWILSKLGLKLYRYYSPSLTTSIVLLYTILLKETAPCPFLFRSRYRASDLSYHTTSMRSFVFQVMYRMGVFHLLRRLIKSLTEPL